MLPNMEQLKAYLEDIQGELNVLRDLFHQSFQAQGFNENPLECPEQQHAHAQTRHANTQHKLQDDYTHAYFRAQGILEEFKKKIDALSHPFKGSRILEPRSTEPFTVETSTTEPSITTSSVTHPSLAKPPASGKRAVSFSHAPGTKLSATDSPATESLSTTDPHATNSSLTIESFVPGFILHLPDLSNRLVPKLQTFVRDSHFSGKVSVGDLGIAPSEIMRIVRSLDIQSVYEVRHSPEESNWHIYTEKMTRAVLPQITDSEQPPADTKQYLEDLYNSPQTDPIPYFIGELPDFRCCMKLRSWFPSGPEVSNLGTLPGISTLWGYAGEPGSGSAFHCEDAYLRSYNLTLIGWKIWIMINPHSTQDFEDLVQRSAGCDHNRCDQFVRHHAIMFPPSKLDEESIAYDIIITGPGDMVLTDRRQYHAVINCTSSFAVATNFVFADEDPVPPNVSFCTNDGLFPLRVTIPKVQPTRPPKRKHIKDSPQVATQRKRASLSKTSPRLIAERPVITPLTSMQLLADHTTNAATIREFMGMVCEWRSADNNLRQELSKLGTCQTDNLERLNVLETVRKSCAQKSRLFSLLETLASVYLFRSLKRQNGLRKDLISTEAINTLLNAQGCKRPTKANRRQLQRKLIIYRKWDQFCGSPPDYPFDGILCFVSPAFEEHKLLINSELSLLKEEDYKQFYQRIRGIAHGDRLCQVGKGFQEAVFMSQEFPKRPFEDKKWDSVQTSTLAELLQLL
ncbi:hypothetical protein QBC35DRAFT_506620 [Podospora australis]|uniref:JmjC domain-containing protein n=1 Tax=Podospora australis TaxID=1536484 RepID=A0AAN6WL47_9PEZI|nr:hypothetical protein QBC35DRAFT_506620 [Podospora australis]